MNDTGRLLRLKAKIIEQAERIAELETSERRRFAGLAMEGILSSCPTTLDHHPADIAQAAAGQADALIAELDMSK